MGTTLGVSGRGEYLSVGVSVSVSGRGEWRGEWGDVREGECESAGGGNKYGRVREG
jgi:hypothetical protein